MRHVFTLATAALIVTLTQGCHTEPPQADMLQTGRVEGVYVEAYAGVFVERQLAGDPTGKALCAYVTFARPLADGRTFATAQLPAFLGVEAGDLVQVRVADPGAFEADALRERNQVTLLVAKSTTQAARDFGNPSPPPTKLSAVAMDRF
ncbi:MAG TPA: hypothetical protein VMH26_14700 [Burkholderiales bacterium]|nr:hypothetical protein [Burkholderiales bacterium]